MMKDVLQKTSISKILKIKILNSKKEYKQIVKILWQNHP